MNRFVRPEPVDGSRRVVRLFDTAHVATRACRTVRAGEGHFEEVRDRMRRLANLAHPHLARVVAVGEEAGDLKVITEWLPGGMFRVEDSPNPAQALVGPAEALYALHREGLCHGHVEPRSLVLDGEGTLKLVDGGVMAGSVREDLVAFGAAIEALYAWKLMPSRLAEISGRAVSGGFGDARALADALRQAARELEPGGGGAAMEPERARVLDTAIPSQRVDEPPEPVADLGRWSLVLFAAFLFSAGIVLSAGLAGWWVGTREAAPADPVAPHASPGGG